MCKSGKMLFLIASILIMAIVTVFSVACGTQGAQSAETKASAEQTSETPAQTTAAETTAAPKPAGQCPSSTSVTIQSDNGAYKERLPISWDSIGSQAAKLTHTTNRTAVFIYIANFETSENLKDVALSDGQAVIQFTVTVAGEGDPVPVSIGKYNVKEWVDNYVSAGIRLTGGTTLSISTGSTETGDFEITSVTDTEICGKFNIDEKWTKMSGEFKVPIVK